MSGYSFIPYIHMVYVCIYVAIRRRKVKPLKICTMRAHTKKNNKKLI